MGIRLFVILLLAAFVGGAAQAADDLSDFTTDGCSLFPDGSPVDPSRWCDCCIEHDMAYWRGGTRADRRRADEALRACVEQRTQSKPFAEVVYTGVRAGGHPVFPTWYRWGYGWKYGRGYRALTTQETALTEWKLAEYRKLNPVLSCDVPGTLPAAIHPLHEGERATMAPREAGGEQQ